MTNISCFAHLLSLRDVEQNCSHLEWTKLDSTLADPKQFPQLASFNLSVGFNLSEGRERNQDLQTEVESIPISRFLRNQLPKADTRGVLKIVVLEREQALPFYHIH